MKTYMCTENLSILTENQLQNLYYVKCRMGYTRTCDQWIEEELMAHRLIYLNNTDVAREHIIKYNGGK